MPRYADDAKEKVRDAVSMLDVVGQYVDLRKSGPVNYKGLCPFHEERTPSFNVNVDEKFFKCFGCGAGGDVFRFVMDKEGLDFIGALEFLADRCGIELERQDEDPAAVRRRMREQRLFDLLARVSGFYQRHLWESREAANARAYLAGRGMDEALCREFGVGYAPRKWDAVLIPSRKAGYTEDELLAAGLVIRSQKGGAPYDRFRARITFPLQDRKGRVMGFGARRLAEDDKGPKYLNSNDGPVFHKGKNVYASHIARAHAAKAGQVILAEGYTDVMALHQAGLRNTVGLMGTSLTPDQVTELARLAPVVVLALDADGAGQEAMVRAARVAAGRKVQLRVVPLPAGMDPADLVQAEGAEAMRALVDQSVPFVAFRVRRELDVADLGSAEGKDAAIDALRPVFAEIPPSAMREELVRLVADRTDLQPTLVASWLSRPAPPAAPQQRSGLPPRSGAAPRSGQAARSGGPQRAAQPSRSTAGDPRGAEPHRTGTPQQDGQPQTATRPPDPSPVTSHGDGALRHPAAPPTPTGSDRARPREAAGPSRPQAVEDQDIWGGLDALEPDDGELDPGEWGGPPSPSAPPRAVPSAQRPAGGVPSGSAPGRPGAPGGHGDGRPPSGPAPGRTPTPPAAPRPAPARGAATAAASPHARTERALLIQVVARPAEGRAALRELGGADAFADSVHRRAVAHLLAHDGPPSAGIPEDDAELASLMAGLVVRAGEESGSAATLDAEVLKLKLAAVERQMRQAQAAGSPDVPALARERLGLQAAVREAIGRHMDAADG